MTIGYVKRKLNEFATERKLGKLDVVLLEKFVKHLEAANNKTEIRKVLRHKNHSEVA